MELSHRNIFSRNVWKFLKIFFVKNSRFYILIIRTRGGRLLAYKKDKNCQKKGFPTQLTWLVLYSKLKSDLTFGSLFQKIAIEKFKAAILEKKLTIKIGPLNVLLEMFVEHSRSFLMLQILSTVTF